MGASRSSSSLRSHCENTCSLEPGLEVSPHARQFTLFIIRRYHEQKHGPGRNQCANRCDQGNHWRHQSRAEKTAQKQTAPTFLCSVSTNCGEAEERPESIFNFPA